MAVKIESCKRNTQANVNSSLLKSSMCKRSIYRFFEQKVRKTLWRLVCTVDFVY